MSRSQTVCENRRSTWDRYNNWQPLNVAGQVVPSVGYENSTRYRRIARTCIWVGLRSPCRDRQTNRDAFSASSGCQSFVSVL